jgi:hypothetical protein
MGLNLANYQQQACEAIKAFWGNRELALLKQTESGKQDQGTRGMVTAGKNMDGFLVLLEDIVRANGLINAKIYVTRKMLVLPGYFRPTKTWDMVIINEGRLVAGVELKSQVGSFGNNANNRAEEVIGTALDFWTAYREGAFGDIPKPFIGWLMLVEDTPESRRPPLRQVPSPNFPLFPEFRGASYADRYKILCQKLVKEQLYSSATILLSPKTAADTGEYSELDEMTSLKTFVTTFAAHIAAEAAMVAG